MRLFRTLALGASALALVVSACTTGGGSSPAASATGATIKIGSESFYESRLMAEIYAQVLEANGYTVQRSLGLGARPVTAAAIESGQIDLRPEYLGSGLGYYDSTKPTGDPEKNRQELQTILSAARAAGSPSWVSRPARTATRSSCAPTPRPSSASRR